MDTNESEQYQRDTHYAYNLHAIIVRKDINNISLLLGLPIAQDILTYCFKIL